MTKLVPKLIFFVSLAIAGTKVFAQQQFYLYIQSGTSQPFYARFQTSIYSSSENGYMIVPKLHDSTYDVFIGFARNAYPEQHFSIDMNRQDQGFELRNLGEKGWGLFNLQNMAMIANTRPEQKIAEDNTGEKKNDAFSQMLANVVNDSSILYTAAKPVPTPPIKKEPADAQPRQDTTLAVVTPLQLPPAAEEKKPPLPDSSLTAKAVDKKDAVAPPEKKAATVNPPTQEQSGTTARKKDAPEKPFITRIAESKSEEAYKAVYIEQYIFSTDTVDINIPLIETAPAALPLPPPVTPQKAPDTTKAALVTPPPAPVSSDTAQKKQAVLVTNSDCKNFASENDVDKLRVKLLAENAVDDKLVAARKYFKTKCFSVKQIKALTELFPGDESKYRFFDASYPFVSDTENFSSLEEMIENDYYKNRFKAMIRK